MLIKLDYLLFRPILSAILPSAWLVWLYAKARPMVAKGLAKKSFVSIAVDRPKNFWGLTFANPLGVAAGLDKDGSMLPFLYQLGAGYVVVGTALPRSHAGNPGTPWVPLTHSHAAINSLGLPSPGIDQVLHNIDHFVQEHQPKGFPIGLSIMGHPLDDAQTKAQGLLDCMQKAVGHVDFIELNQSCPNVGEDLDALDVPDGCFDFDLPVVLKLQPMPPQQKILDLCSSGKVSAIVIGNTRKDYAIEALASADQRHALYFNKTFGGGISGPPLLADNLTYIKQWKRALEDVQAQTLLIGCGGITSSADNAQYLLTCDLTQVYTGLWQMYAKVGARKTWSNFF